jgi:hypothetical protein
MDFDQFYSARLRLARAKEHLQDLDSQIDRFFSEKPYTRIVEPDPDGIHKILKIRLTKRFPFRWRILATEIIEHARSSLDHATWAAAWLNTKNPNLEFGVFPFVKDGAKLAERINGASKDCPAEIRALLRTFKPYKDGDGNKLLYALSDMCNLSKHALVTFMPKAWATGKIRGYAFADGIQFYDEMILDPLKNEITYARVRLEANFDHEVDFTIHPMLDYREMTISEPAILILASMIGEAERIVSEIEAMCRQIGLIK